jgi:hypothetical protein
MNNLNNSCSNEEKETKLIISSLLTDMITKVLLMCQQQNLAKLNRERVSRCRERKRQRNANEYMRQVRKQK